MLQRLDDVTRGDHASRPANPNEGTGASGHGILDVALACEGCKPHRVVRQRAGNLTAVEREIRLTDGPFKCWRYRVMFLFLFDSPREAALNFALPVEKMRLDLWSDPQRLWLLAFPALFASGPGLMFARGQMIWHFVVTGYGRVVK